MDRSEQIEEVSAALVGACGELHNVAKDAENPYFSSRYASLPAILDAVRPVLAKHGLSVIQLPRNHPESSAVGVETILLHASGQYLSQTILVRPAKDDPQGVGSAITYCRRYALAAALGIGQEDDDGNAASVPHPEPLRPAPAAPPARRPEPQRSAAHLQQQPARDPVPDRLQNGAINEAQAKLLWARATVRAKEFAGVGKSDVLHDVLARRGIDQVEEVPRAALNSVLSEVDSWEPPVDATDGAEAF